MIFPIFLIPPFLSMGSHIPWELPPTGSVSPLGQQHKACLLIIIFLLHPPTNCYYLTLTRGLLNMIPQGLYYHYQLAVRKKRVLGVCLRSQSKWATERYSKTVSVSFLLHHSYPLTSPVLWAPPYLEHIKWQLEWMFPESRKSVSHPLQNIPKIQHSACLIIGTQ